MPLWLPEEILTRVLEANLVCKIVLIMLRLQA